MPTRPCFSKPKRRLRAVVRPADHQLAAKAIALALVEPETKQVDGAVIGRRVGWGLLSEGCRNAEEDDDEREAKQRPILHAQPAAERF